MSWNNPEKRRGRFHNPHIEDLKRTIWDLILWRLGYYNEPDRPSFPSSEEFIYPVDRPLFDENLPSAVWLGHSTYLLQTGGITFLTDPIFSLHCSPIPIRALKRHHEPPFRISELPQIHVVLLSHNHYDHLDEKSILELHRSHPEILWIVPSGVKRWFMKRGITKVCELGWGDTYDMNSTCKITAVPAQHFSGRTLWDKNRTLWCGYVVECGEKVFYFAGDTGYNPIDFKQIGLRFPAIDLSLIPIGTYVPKAFMQPVHVSPEEAVQIHCDVGSRFSLGMHWKTFILSEEPPTLPPYDLFIAMQRQELPLETFLPLEPGDYVNW